MTAKKKAKKRKPTFIQKWHNEFNKEWRDKVKKQRLERLAVVLQKEKFETWLDVLDFFHSLTSAQVTVLACQALEVFHLGKKPADLLEDLKKRAAKPPRKSRKVKVPDPPIEALPA